MKFFLPFADDPQIAETYQTIRKFVQEKCSGGPLSPARYYSITFMRRSKVCSATVGEIEPLVRETVIAIFRRSDDGLHFICTENRGVASGGPLLESDVYSAVEFEAEPKRGK